MCENTFLWCLCGEWRILSYPLRNSLEKSLLNHWAPLHSGRSCPAVRTVVNSLRLTSAPELPWLTSVFWGQPHLSWSADTCPLKGTDGQYSEDPTGVLSSAGHLLQYEFFCLPLLSPLPSKILAHQNASQHALPQNPTATLCLVHSNTTILIFASCLCFIIPEMQW